MVQASLIGGSLWSVRDPDQCPHLHHWAPIYEMPLVPTPPTGRPRPPPALVAGSESSYWRGESNEKSTAAVPHDGLPHPPPGCALGPATDSGGGPRGGMGTRKWDRMSGRRDSRGREKQMAGIRRLLGTPPSGPPPIGWPGLATSGCGTGPHSAVSSGDDRLTATAPLGRGICSTSPPRQQPFSSANVPELLNKHEGAGHIARVQWLKPLAMLFCAQADLLDDSSHQVSEDQEILDGQMLGRHLHLPREQRSPTCLGRLLEEIKERFWSSCGPF